MVIETNPQQIHYTIDGDLFPHSQERRNSKLLNYWDKFRIQGDYSYRIATPCKALCDKLYTMSHCKNKKELRYLLFDDLRIDED